MNLYNTRGGRGDMKPYFAIKNYHEVKRKCTTYGILFRIVYSF